MKLKLRFTLLSLLYAFSANCQDNLSDDKITTQTLQQRFEGGEMGFSQFMGSNLKYPMNARLNCRIGTLITDFLVNRDGDIDSIKFRNDISLGMGIEEEVTRCLASTKGRWSKARQNSKLTITVSFFMDEANIPQSTVGIMAYGLPVNGCPTDNDLIKSFNAAKSNKKYKEAIGICEDLIRRLPTSEKYKKELTALKTEIDLPNINEREPIVANPLLFRITRETPIFDYNTKKQIEYEDYISIMQEREGYYKFEPMYDEFGQPSSFIIKEKTAEERADNSNRILADPSSAPKVGEKIKPFVMGTSDGEVFDSELLKDNVVILYYMLDLNAKVNEQFLNEIKQIIDDTKSKGAVWIGLSSKSLEEVRDYTEGVKPNIKIVPYAQGFQIRYSAFTTPAFIVIKKGKVVANIVNVMIDNKLQDLKKVILESLK